MTKRAPGAMSSDPSSTWGWRGAALARVSGSFAIWVRVLGVAITPAERRDLTERPTADLQAFLAFSRGLEAEDRGDFAAAEANYSAALARDPNFRAARDRRTSAQRSAQAVQTTPSQLAGLEPGGGFGDNGPLGGTSAAPGGRGPILRSGLVNTIPSTGTTLTTRAGNGGGPVSRQPGVRPQLPETLGGDGITPGLTSTIIIIITRP